MIRRTSANLKYAIFCINDQDIECCTIFRRRNDGCEIQSLSPNLALEDIFN